MCCMCAFYMTWWILTYMCMCVYIYIICMYACMYAYVCMYVCMYTGPPAKDNFREDCGDAEDCGSLQATRRQSTNYGYGHLVAHNSTHLQYSQIRNNDSAIEDKWTIVQGHHGPRGKVFI